jgi:hypothetical protein
MAATGKGVAGTLVGGRGTTAFHNIFGDLWAAACCCPLYVLGVGRMCVQFRICVTMGDVRVRLRVWTSIATVCASVLVGCRWARLGAREKQSSGQCVLYCFLSIYFRRTILLRYSYRGGAGDRTLHASHGLHSLVYRNWRPPLRSTTAWRSSGTRRMYRECHSQTQPHCRTPTRIALARSRVHPAS